MPYQFCVVLPLTPLGSRILGRVMNSAKLRSRCSPAQGRRVAGAAASILSGGGWSSVSYGAHVSPPGRGVHAGGPNDDCAHTQPHSAAGLPAGVQQQVRSGALPWPLSCHCALCGLHAAAQTEGQSRDRLGGHRGPAGSSVCPICIGITRADSRASLPSHLVRLWCREQSRVAGFLSDSSCACT